MAAKQGKPELPAPDGKYSTGLDTYPGDFSFPPEMLDRHMRVYWRMTVEEGKDISRLDYDAIDMEYRAYVTLITDYGSWNVPGFPAADLLTDSVPAVLKNRITEAGQLHVWRFLSPARLRVVSAITSIL